VYDPYSWSIYPVITSTRVSIRKIVNFSLSGADL
jgi:hypothetical protein